MKKRLKGLVCCWLTIIMVISMMVTPAMGVAYNAIYLYTGTNPLKADGELYPYTRATVYEDTQLSSLITDTPEGATLSGWNLWKFENINSGFVISEKLMTQDADWTLSADDVETYATGDYFAFEPVWAYTVKLYTGGNKLTEDASVDPSEITEVQVTLDVPLKDQTALSAYIPEDLIGWKRWTISDGSVYSPGFTAADKTLTKYNIKDTMLLEAVDFATLVVSKNSRPLDAEYNYYPKNEKKVYLDFGEKLNEADAVMNELNKPAGYVLDGWKLWGGVESGGIYTDHYDEPKTVAVDYALTKEDALSLGDSTYKYFLILEPLWMQKYKIDPQPTSESPTVGAKEYDADEDVWTDITDDPGVNYQWYEETSETYYLTDEHTDLVESAEAEYSGDAWYQKSTWSEAWPVSLCLEQGTVLRVEPVGTTGIYGISLYDGQQLENKGGYWEVTLDSAVETYLVVEYQERPTKDEDGVKIQITEKSLGTAVDGQIANTLSSGVEGNQYVCRVTFENGDVLTSDAVTYIAPPEYTVVFKANGGDCDTTSLETVEGKLASLPAATRVGYIFNGWFDESEGGKEITTATEFSADTTVYAQWTAYEITQQPTADNEYEVRVNPSNGVAYTWHEMTETAVTTENANIFDANGSSSYNQETGEWTCPLTGAGEYKEDYYYFTNLELVSGDIIRLTFSDEENQVLLLRKGNRNDYIYKYCPGTEVDVQIDADDTYSLCVVNTAGTNTKTVKAKVIHIGEAIDGQTTSKLTDGVDGTKYVAKITYPDGAVLTSDAVSYVSPTFDVIFDANGGTAVSKQTVDNGGTVEEPTSPIKTGYTFAGWYKDSGLTTAWDFDTDTVTEPVTLYAKWVEKATVIIDTKPQDYVYNNGEAIAFAIDSTLPDIKVEYSVKNTDSWSENAPATVGEYDVRITRAEDDDYKAYSENIAGGLVINKAVVNEPAIASKVYNGENQKANVPSSERYTVTSNEGRTTVGTANVVLTLVDSTNYKWSSTAEASVTVSFAITKADNAWVSEPTIEGWTYGDDANAPAYAAKFGDVIAEYKKANEEDSAYAATVPENAGDYNVRFTVNATDDFGGLSEVVDLTIAKAAPAYTAPSNVTATYDQTLADAELPEGWTWKDSTLSVGNAGTNEFTAVFTPQDTTNYKVVEINVNVAVEKANPTYATPSNLTATYGETLANVTLPDGWTWKDATTTSVGNAGTNTFRAVFTPSDTSNYKTVEEDVTITIAKQKVAKPDENTTVFTYTGNEQTYELATDTRYEITGDKRTDAGNQTVTVSLKDTANYEWADGTVADATYTFNIGKAQAVIAVETTPIVKTYGEEWTLPVATSNFGTPTCDKTVAEMASAGNYEVTYTVAGNENYDGDSKTISVTINPATITKPAADSAAFVYNGSEQTYSVVANDKYTVNGNKMTDAGEQTVTVALKDKANYTWADGSTTDVTFTFTIAPKSVEGATVGTFTAMTYTENAQTPEATVTIDGLTATGTWSSVTDVEDKTTFTANGNFTGTIANQSTGMAKATPVVTAPTVKADLIYNTSAQALADAGSTTGGTMQYSIDNATWSENVPAGTNAGDYTVYYKVVGNGNYNDVAVQSVSVRIANADMSAGVAKTGYNGVFDNGAHTINVTIPEGASVKYGTADGTYDLDAAPQYTDAGTYTVYYKVEKTNYTEVTDSADVVITAKDISNAEITLGEALTFRGATQTQTITSATVDGLTITYDVSGNENTNAGDYTLTITGNGNFTGTAQKAYIIAKATPVENPEKPTTAKVDKGDTLAEATVTDGEFFAVDNTTVLEGTFTWVDETEIIRKDTTKRMKFTPDDANYSEIEMDVAVDSFSSGGGSSSVSHYTVKFDTDGGSNVSNVTVTRNAKLTEPAEPTKEGFVFDGWYTDKNYETRYDFDKAVTKGFTLYAKWVETEKEPENTDMHNCPSKAFADLDTAAWYHLDTDYVLENGIFKGVSETEFAPDGKLTRAMLVTVLYRAEGEPATNRSIPFADVDMGAYYANAVIWAKQNGIVMGVSETEFAPDSNITREQIAAIMHRYAQYKGYDVSAGEDTNILSYSDFDSISEYAIASMQWACGSGLMKGKTNTTLNPKDYATRAEIAAILHRFLEANK